MYYSVRIGLEIVKDFCSAGLLSDIRLVVTIQVSPLFDSSLPTAVRQG